MRHATLLIRTAAATFGAAMLSTGCTTAGAGEAVMSDRAAERLAQFEATGETEDCLSTTRIQSITPLDDRHFLVRVGTNDYYLNKVSSRCGGASRAGNRLQYTISGGQLCRNEIISVVDNSSGFTVGSCGLNSFEKLERVEVETQAQ